MSTAASPERGAELAALLHEVRHITLRTERLVDDLLVGGYRSVFRGSGLEFEEVREYTPGDDPRAVDWAVTARTGKPYVKTFVDERELPVVFVLDLSPSLRTGLGAWSPRAMAARLAAALGLAAVQNDDRVGMLACGAGIERWLPPRQGRALDLKPRGPRVPGMVGEGEVDAGARALVAVLLDETR